jgi:polysaccharide biosynthesis protein PslA
MTQKTEQNLPKRRLRFTSNVLSTVGILIDATALTAAYGLSFLAYQQFIGGRLVLQAVETAAILHGINFFLIGMSRGAYSNFKGQAEDVGLNSIADFFVAVFLTTFTVLLFGAGKELSRAAVVLYLITGPIMLFASRIAFRKLAWLLMNQGVIGQRIVLYCQDRSTVARVDELFAIERLPHLKLLGFSDDRKERVDQTAVGELNYLGAIDDVIAMARSGEVDQVMIALPEVGQERLEALIAKLGDAAIDICCLPKDILNLRLSYRIGFIGSLPVFSLWQRPIRDFDIIVKGLQDRILALLGAVFLSPLLIVVALAIKLESPGKILFVQQRFGFNNKKIDVYKFRSMRSDGSDASGARRAKKGDDRVTRVGRIIRRLSIDELPQLINVLKGEMSLVGPRPHATQMRVGDSFYFDAVDGYASRHRVKPGITGLAQIRGLRGEIDTIERARKRIEYDKYYIENWSPLLDLRIIFETIFKVFWDRHAY